jgi:hypothetical protein
MKPVKLRPGAVLAKNELIAIEVSDDDGGTTTIVAPPDVLEVITSQSSAAAWLRQGWMKSEMESQS